MASGRGGTSSAAALEGSGKLTRQSRTCSPPPPIPLPRPLQPHSLASARPLATFISSLLFPFFLSLSLAFPLFLASFLFPPPISLFALLRSFICLPYVFASSHSPLLQASFLLSFSLPSSFRHFYLPLLCLCFLLPSPVLRSLFIRHPPPSFPYIFLPLSPLSAPLT